MIFKKDNFIFGSILGFLGPVFGIMIFKFIGMPRVLKKFFLAVRLSDHIAGVQIQGKVIACFAGVFTHA